MCRVRIWMWLVLVAVWLVGTFLGVQCIEDLLEDTPEREGRGVEMLSVVLPLFPSLCFLGFLFEQSRNFALLSILNF